MKREDALIAFVRNNFKLLKEKDNFDKKKYDAIKKDFFAKKLKHKFGIPRDKEICNYLVGLLIKSQDIADKEHLEPIISETPFLRNNNIQADEYLHLIDIAKNKYAIKEELEVLNPIEKLEKMTEFVKRESIKEIDELIQQKQEEYRKLPSILDDEKLTEPEELPQRTEEREWWEELNLKENPFPGSLDGFSQINKSLYKEIIIETQPIKWALSKLPKATSDLFHKGFLLGGEFGTGKTTFFDYMAPLFVMEHIEPIRVAISDNMSVSHYIQKFEKLICIEITKLAKKYQINDFGRICDFEESRLVMYEIQQHGVKGYFIFIDDLHKNIESSMVFKFLSNLQIIKNTFSRDNINVFFMVAGFPSWRDRILQDSALTGFFDASDELILPTVTPELAASAIKKRLQAYSINPEKELSVKPEFFKIIFKKVSSEIGEKNIGFRPYIQEALNYFIAKKYDILNIDFTRLSDETIHEIKKMLESNNSFKKHIDKLIFGGGIKKKEIRELTLKLLCEIYLRQGVEEDETIFINNKFSFKQLIDSNLIQKYNRNGKLAWKIAHNLDDLNKKVIGRHNLSLEDYLLPIYSFPTIRQKDKIIERTKVEAYEEDLRNLSGYLDYSILENTQNALKLYSENIFPYAENVKQKTISQIKNAQLEKIRECIWSLMKSIIKFESPSLLDICGERDIRGWKLRHRSLEASQHFIALEQNMETEGGDVEEVDTARLISYANDTFDELWHELKKSITIYQSSLVKCYDLRKEILETIYSEHDHLFAFSRPKEEYFETFQKYIETVEKDLRQYLLVSCTLIFGPYHERLKYYPDNIRKYITKSTPSPSISYESYNEFENMNRGQYRFLFTQISKTSELYRYVIEPIIKNWDSKDLGIFFSLFGDLNIATSHIKASELEEKKKEIPTFFRLSCRFMAALSSHIRNLLIQRNVITESSSKTIVQFGHQYMKNNEPVKIVKMEEAKDIPTFLYPYEISSLITPESENRISDNSDNLYGAVEIDVSDIEKIRISFGMNYCDTIALIAYLLARGKYRAITLYGTNIYLFKIKI